MDPNNLQQTNTQPIMQSQQPIAGVPPQAQPQQQQPAMIPQAPPPPFPQQPPVTPIDNAPQMTQGGNKKGLLILLIGIMLVLILGMGFYIFSMSSNEKKNTSNNMADVAIPTLKPTLAAFPTIPPTIDEVEVYDPEIDIKALEDGLGVL